MSARADRAVRRLSARRIDFARDVVARAEPLVIEAAASGGRQTKGGPQWATARDKPAPSRADAPSSQTKSRPPSALRADAAWRQLPRWTPKALAARFGVRLVQAASSATARFDYGPERPDYDVVELPFDELVARILRPARRARRLYLMQQPLHSVFPELEAALPLPHWLAARPVARQLWLGAAGNITPLHRDGAHNLFAQIYGRKRFVIFAPEDSARLYPLAAQSRYPHVSRVDPLRPDRKAFPEYARAKPLETVVEPGELLFLPAGFWHHVQSIDVSISVNAWWAPPGVRLTADHPKPRVAR